MSSDILSEHKAMTDKGLDALFEGARPHNTQGMLVRLANYLQLASEAPNLSEAELNETRARQVFFAVKESFEHYAEMHNHAFNDMKAALRDDNTSDEARDLDTVCQGLRRVLNRLAHRCVHAADLWAIAHAALLAARAQHLGAQRAAAPDGATAAQIENDAELARAAADKLRTPAMRRAWADERLLEYGLPSRPPA